MMALNDSEFTAREYLRGIREPLSAVGERRWAVWWRSIPQAALQRLIDDVAGYLHLPWPRSRKAETLATYADLSLDEVMSQRGIGAQKARTIIWVVGLVAWNDDVVALAKDIMLGPTAVPDLNSAGREGALPVPPEPHSRKAEERVEPEVDALGVALSNAAQTLEEIDIDEPADEATEGMVRALVEAASQTARHNHDDQSRLHVMLLARLGQGSEGATLAEIGSEVGLTRERVRQLLVRANRRMRSSYRDIEVRLLNCYRSWFLQGRDAADLARLNHMVRTVFGKPQKSVLFESESLAAEVELSVRRAYREGATPLALHSLVERLRHRLGDAPDIDAVRQLCVSQGVLTEVEGVELVYADTTKDRIHRALMEAGEPLDHKALEAATGLPRGALYSYTGKDARLIQQDDGRWVPFRDLPVSQCDGGSWVILGRALDSTGDFLGSLFDDVFSDVTPRSVEKEDVPIPLDAMVEKAVKLLTDQGVFNATVGGFWRACSVIAEREYGAEFPERVAAVPLGQLAIDRTPYVVVGGKRRVGSALHPDRVEEQDNAYWIRKALCKLGGPCTVGEFSRTLDAMYQHGPPYLHRSWIEYYADEVGFRRFTPKQHPQMGLLLPPGWAPGDAPPTPGVRRLARRVARWAHRRYGDLRQSDFAGVEWFAALLDDEAGGFPWRSD